MNKFGNIRTDLDGYSFASKLEAAVYQYIKLREKAGELKLIQVQDHVSLWSPIKYVPDFKCVDLKTDKFIWIEAKGYASDKWPIIKKGWKETGPGKLEVWQGDYRRPQLTSVIEGQHPGVCCSVCGR